MRCCRGNSALEGYHLHYRVFFPPTATSCGPEWHELLKNRFDFCWSVKAGRVFNSYCKEVNESTHFDMYLFDIAAISARRAPYYDQRVPFTGHRILNMGIAGERTARVRHGFYFQGECIKQRRQDASPALLNVASTSTESSSTASSVYFSALIGFDGPLRTRPTRADIQFAAKQKALWHDARAMQLAMLERGLFMDQRKWKEFIDSRLRDQEVWTILKASGLLQLKDKLSKPIVASEAQASFLTTPAPAQNNTVPDTVPHIENEEVEAENNDLDDLVSQTLERPQTFLGGLLQNIQERLIGVVSSVTSTRRTETARRTEIARSTKTGLALTASHTNESTNANAATAAKAKASVTVNATGFLGPNAGSHQMQAVHSQNGKQKSNSNDRGRKKKVKRKQKYSRKAMDRRMYLQNIRRTMVAQRCTRDKAIKHLETKKRAAEKMRARQEAKRQRQHK